MKIEFEVADQVFLPEKTRAAFQSLIGAQLSRGVRDAIESLAEIVRERQAEERKGARVLESHHKHIRKLMTHYGERIERWKRRAKRQTILRRLPD